MMLLRFMKLGQLLALLILWLQIVATEETATLVVGHAPVVLTSSWLRISNRIVLELHPSQQCGYGKTVLSAHASPTDFAQPKTFGSVQNV